MNNLNLQQPGKSRATNLTALATATKQLTNQCQCQVGDKCISPARG